MPRTGRKHSGTVSDINIKFDIIRYWHLQNGNVNILFDSTEETKLFFDGGNFSRSSDVHNACYNTYNIESQEKTHVINNIKETDDFDFILQIDDTIYMKIFYMPDDSYENGVVQTFCVYRPTDPFYDDIICDYNESDDFFQSRIGRTEMK